MSFSTPLSIAGRWNYGPFWETIIENPDYDLPQWSQAHEEIGALFNFLHHKLLLEVQKYIDGCSPFSPIYYLPKQEEYFHENERRSHFLTINYFNAVCGAIVIGMQTSNDENARQIMTFEITRLRSLLKAITAIVRPDNFLPTGSLDHKPRKVEVPNRKTILEYRGRGNSTNRRESTTSSESDSGMSSDKTNDRSANDSHSEDGLDSLPCQTKHESEWALTSDEEDFESYEKEIHNMVLDESVQREDSFRGLLFSFALPPLSSTPFHWQSSNDKYAEPFPW